ncbi:MAG: hypothetical protein ACXW2C_08110 [Acidimicrobiia bacterium]
MLAALRRGGDGNAMTPTALARVANGLPAGMTNRLDRLEAADLVARRPDPSARPSPLRHVARHPPRRSRVAPSRRRAFVSSDQNTFASVSPRSETRSGMCPLAGADTVRPSMPSSL